MIGYTLKATAFIVSIALAILIAVPWAVAGMVWWRDTYVQWVWSVVFG